MQLNSSKCEKTRYNMRTCRGEVGDNSILPKMPVNTSLLFAQQQSIVAV